MEPNAITPNDDSFLEASFQIVYTGSALSSGAINASDFARAIIALQRIVEEINLRVNGNEYEATLDILRVEPGSSISTLILKVKKLGRKLVKTGKSDEIDATNKILSIIKNTLSITADVSAGLFFIISLVHSSPAPRVESKGDVVNIYNTNNTFITVERGKYELANNTLIMSQAAKVVMPLIKDGVDEFYVRGVIREPKADQIAYAERITKDNLGSFALESQEDIRSQEMAEVVADYRAVALSAPVEVLESKNIKRDDIYTKGVYKILSVPIADINSAWQLKGKRKISAVILDQKFLQQIRDRALTLGENDALEVELVQRFSASRSRYEVVQVFHHLPGGKRVVDSK